jgi:hypothetical protein
VCPGEGGVDVLEEYVGEVVSLVDRDQVDVLAESLVEQVGPAQCGAPKKISSSLRRRLSAARMCEIAWSRRT